MAKYDDTSSSDGAICPYCGHINHVEHESYSDNMRVEECQFCDKKFHQMEDFTVYHECKPDCTLNGDEHDFSIQHTYKDGSIYYFCSECGEIKED